MATFSSRPVIRGRFAAVAWLLLSAAALTGCEQERKKAASVPPPLTPEERFEIVVDTLEEQINDGSLDAATATSEANSPPGTPITNATVRVSHEVFPRKSDTGPLQAKICLTTKAKVVVAIPPPTEQEKQAAEEERVTKQSQYDENLDGIADLESLKVPKSGGLTGRLGSSSIHEMDQGEVQSCYEFEFRDGKWELTTELDREKEPFNSLAIEYALRKQ
jgi:hypothetical protein